MSLRGRAVYSSGSDLAGSGVKPSSDSALRDASSDSARARISLVASKALTAESAESLADASDALTASTEAYESFAWSSLMVAASFSACSAASASCRS